MALMGRYARAEMAMEALAAIRGTYDRYSGLHDGSLGHSTDVSTDFGIYILLMEKSSRICYSKLGLPSTGLIWPRVGRLTDAHGHVGAVAWTPLRDAMVSLGTLLDAVRGHRRVPGRRQAKPTLPNGHWEPALRAKAMPWGVTGRAVGVRHSRKRLMIHLGLRVFFRENCFNGTVTSPRRVGRLTKLTWLGGG